jgi:hypothetical protein
MVLGDVPKDVMVGRDPARTYHTPNLCYSDRSSAGDVTSQQGRGRTPERESPRAEEVLGARRPQVASAGASTAFAGALALLSLPLRRMFNIQRAPRSLGSLDTYIWMIQSASYAPAPHFERPTG